LPTEANKNRLIEDKLQRQVNLAAVNTDACVFANMPATPKPSGTTLVSTISVQWTSAKWFGMHVHLDVGLQWSMEEEIKSGNAFAKAIAMQVDGIKQHIVVDICKQIGTA
jgi:hypothetical protein